MSQNTVSSVSSSIFVLVHYIGYSDDMTIRHLHGSTDRTKLDNERLSLALAHEAKRERLECLDLLMVGWTARHPEPEDYIQDGRDTWVAAYEAERVRFSKLLQVEEGYYEKNQCWEVVEVPMV